jgi:glycerol-3-phosphate acyltransferase PlsY
MLPTMGPVLGLMLAYALGSIPSAYIAGKVLRGIDLRQHGSGNLGATNVARVLGGKVAVCVLLFDGLKGFLPVYFLPRWFAPDHSLAWAIAFGVAAILGHYRPIFLLWKGGGKGVATAGGVFMALAPVAMTITLGVFALVVAVTRFVSLGSICAAITLPIALAVGGRLRSPTFLISLGVCAFVFWTHRSNIGRLRRGEEPRFGAKHAPATSPPRAETAD